MNMKLLPALQPFPKKVPLELKSKTGFSVSTECLCLGALLATIVRLVSLSSHIQKLDITVYHTGYTYKHAFTA